MLTHNVPTVSCTVSCPAAAAAAVVVLTVDGQDVVGEGRRRRRRRREGNHPQKNAEVPRDSYIMPSGNITKSFGEKKKNIKKLKKLRTSTSLFHDFHSILFFYFIQKLFTMTPVAS